MVTVLAWTVVIAAIFGLCFGILLGEGWLLMTVYNAFAPEAWVHLNFWPAVGAALLLSIFFGGSGASARRSA